MIELCCEYLSVRCILLYVLIMSCTCFSLSDCKWVWVQLQSPDSLWNAYVTRIYSQSARCFFIVYACLNLYIFYLDLETKICSNISCVLGNLVWVHHMFLAWHYIHQQGFLVLTIIHFVNFQKNKYFYHLMCTEYFAYLSNGWHFWLLWNYQNQLFVGVLEISQNSQTNTCAGVSFLIKLETDLTHLFSYKFC